MTTLRHTRSRVARALQRRFGALVWFGAYTGMWWALIDNRRLIEATDPHSLAEAIVSARKPR